MRGKGQGRMYGENKISCDMRPENMDGYYFVRF